MPALNELFEQHGLDVRHESGGEWSSPCPACGGNDRCRIWPEKNDGRGRFWCRQCGAQGDGIEFLRTYCGMSFREAAEAFGRKWDTVSAGMEKSSALPFFAPKRQPDVFTSEHRPESPAVIDRSAWNAKALELARVSVARLLNEPEALRWLSARGIDEKTAVSAGLGWIPGENGRSCMFRARSAWGLRADDGAKKRRALWIPRGICIPRVFPVPGAGSCVDRIRIRRKDEDRAEFRPTEKYHVIEGSRMDLYTLPCLVRRRTPSPVIVVESELDAVMIRRFCGDFAHAVSCMTAGIRNISPADMDFLRSAPLILVSHDNDDAGIKGAARWIETFAHAKLCPVPFGKDPGEAYAAGLDVRGFFTDQLPDGLRFLLGIVDDFDAPAEQDAPEDDPGGAGHGDAAGKDHGDAGEDLSGDDPGFRPVPDSPLDPGSSPLARLAAMMRGVPMGFRWLRSGDGERCGYTLVYDRRWQLDNYEVFSGISRAVFWDSDIFDALCDIREDLINDGWFRERGYYDGDAA